MCSHEVSGTVKLLLENSKELRDHFQKVANREKRFKAKQQRLLNNQLENKARAKAAELEAEARLCNPEKRKNAIPPRKARPASTGGTAIRTHRKAWTPVNDPPADVGTIRASTSEVVGPLGALRRVSNPSTSGPVEVRILQRPFSSPSLSLGWTAASAATPSTANSPHGGGSGNAMISDDEAALPQARFSGSHRPRPSTAPESSFGRPILRTSSKMSAWGGHTQTNKLLLSSIVTRTLTASEQAFWDSAEGDEDLEKLYGFEQEPHHSPAVVPSDRGEKASLARLGKLMQMMGPRYKLLSKNVQDALIGEEVLKSDLARKASVAIHFQKVTRVTRETLMGAEGIPHDLDVDEDSHLRRSLMSHARRRGLGEVDEGRPRRSPLKRAASAGSIPRS